MTLLRKLLIKFINKSIELLYPDSRKAAILLLVLNSPDSSEILHTVIGLTDSFFLNSKKSFASYLESDEYSSEILEFLLTNKDLDDYSDFLYSGDKSYMRVFQNQFLAFTYNANPFLTCLSSSDYIFFQEYFNSEVSNFDSYVIQSYMASLVTMNAGMILDSTDETYNN